MNWHRRLPGPLLRLLKEANEKHAIHRRRRHAARNLQQAAQDISRTCLDDVRDLGEWKERRKEYQRQLSWMLGLDVVRARTSVNAESSGVLLRQGYSVEKIIFQSLPRLYVTANFYLPSGVEEPAPCIVYLCGHWPSPAGAKVGFQDRYQWYPRNGMCCLVVDPLQFGEVPGMHQGTARLNRWDWLSLGYTPAGVEVWNAMRAIDWLEHRSEVDRDRIGVTGISGGGVMSQYLAAMDERVAAAVPSCSTYTIGTQVAEDLVQEQCDCTFYPNVHRFDFPVVLALIAPRPLLILGGSLDPIFPPSGYREAYLRAKGVYRLYPGEGGERIGLVESRSGHEDPPLHLAACRRWFSRWLGRNAKTDCNGASAAENTQHVEDGRDLVCLSSKPQRCANYDIHDAWIETAPFAGYDSKEQWASRKATIAGVLRDRVMGWTPRRTPALATRKLRYRGDFVSKMAFFGEFEFDAEEGVPIHAYVMLPRHTEPPKSTVYVVRAEQDHVRFPDIDQLLPLLPDTAVVLVTPRFADEPLSPREFAQVERTAALTGRTLAAMRVWDLLRAITWAGDRFSLSQEHIAVYGRREGAVVALLGGALDERIEHVVVEELPASFKHGAALLTVLRDVDIPEVVSTLAPRRLTLLKCDPAVGRAALQGYSISGSGERLRTARSLPEAVLGGDQRGNVLREGVHE